jgi:lipopolysaccharide export LptBFGC system permease protein LptF
MTMLRRILERMAELSPPRHRELVRGMVAELDAIADPAERTRFALGAVAAIARLALSGYGRATVHALVRWIGVGEPAGGANPGGRSMSKLTAPQLLRRHVGPFALSGAVLTLLLLANAGARQWPLLSAREGRAAGTLVEVLALSVPHTLALTIPMAVFLAVAWVFARLGTEGALSSARRERRGLRRLLAPVLGAAAVVSALTFVSNSQVVPRANTHLAAVLAGAPREPSDRTMTLGELRAAAQRARSATGADAAARVAAYEVEIQKKLALAAACLFLALVAAGISVRFPRGGVGLALGASGLVFLGYYVLLVVGESLADRQALSPLVAMWMPNVLLLAVGLLLVRRPSRPDAAGGAETLAIGVQ